MKAAYRYALLPPAAWDEDCEAQAGAIQQDYWDALLALHQTRLADVERALRAAHAAYGAAADRFAALERGSDGWGDALTALKGNARWRTPRRVSPSRPSIRPTTRVCAPPGRERRSAGFTGVIIIASATVSRMRGGGLRKAARELSTFIGMDKEVAMQSFETRIGSRLVRSILNAGRWSSRLYVNEGETATLSTAKHKTEAAARKWAEKVLAS